MKPAFKLLIAAVALTLGFAAPVIAGSPDEDAILSKSDTRAMFAFSRSQWEANVAAVVAARLGEATGSPKTGIGVSLKTPYGVVQTLPIYVGSDAKPNKLQVTVEYGDCLHGYSVTPVRRPPSRKPSRRCFLSTL
jgi:hypothetical protein